MDDLVNRILLMTLVFCISWNYSESYTLDYKTYVGYNNKTLLARYKRQIQGQACNGAANKFQCATTSDCIDDELQCNGKEDCPDGSDEKESLCKNIYCPGFLFKCEYGACISTDQKCDGVKDCVDNSDEVNCPVSNKINSNCRSDQFECTNGQCIEVDGKCNGIADCDDKSDETEELCLNVFCPGYTYKCRYGACVDGDAKCNGVKNCLDNSDEDEKSCPQEPVTTAPVVYGKKCTTPPQLSHGYWTYLSDGTKGEGNKDVAVGTVIIFSCDQGYKLSSTNEDISTVFCKPDSTWSLTTPVCQKLCPVIYNSPLITFTCKNDGSIVPCNKATDDTILTYKCAPYYEAPFGRPERSTCYDGSWDYTPECIPVCGEKRVSATPLVVNGHQVESGNYPWVVALYSKQEDYVNYINICGGSLLTTGIVLTAAHCVSNQDGGKAIHVKFFRVGAGKYYNKYNDARDNDTAQYVDVAEILLNREYKGEVQNFRGDIALLRLKSQFALSKVVQPVCYNNLQSLTQSTLGVITGWGYTTSTGKPSDVLKELELPYNDDSQCERELDPEFVQRYLTPDKLCAGFFNKNTSVCKGDSGGGLVFKNPSYKNRFFVHGIVSVAHSFAENSQVHCNIQRSALFTRVESYIEWVQLTVQRWSRNVGQTR